MRFSSTLIQIWTGTKSPVCFVVSLYPKFNSFLLVLVCTINFRLIWINKSYFEQPIWQRYIILWIWPWKDDVDWSKDERWVSNIPTVNLTSVGANVWKLGSDRSSTDDRLWSVSGCYRVKKVFLRWLEENLICYQKKSDNKTNDRICPTECTTEMADRLPAINNLDGSRTWK